MVCYLDRSVLMFKKHKSSKKDKEGIDKPKPGWKVLCPDCGFSTSTTAEAIIGFCTLCSHTWELPD